jgi:hypothetical protein
MPGPPPKRSAQRRRRNKPKSYGAASPLAFDAAEAPEALGFEAHNLIEGLWSALRESVEGQFYSAADWQRVRLELWFGHQLVSGGRAPGAQAWSTFQSGLQALLVSPAEKRRLGIDARPTVVDNDELAAVASIANYKRMLE